MNVSSASILFDDVDPDRSPGEGISRLLVQAAQRHPSSGLRLLPAALDGESELMTYPVLLDQARRIAGGIRALGLRPGAKVALLLEAAGDFIPAFWACVLGGYVPCPLVPIRNDADRWEKYLAHIDTLLEHPLVITVAAMADQLPRMSVTELEQLRTHAPSEAIHSVSLSDPAILMLTSGSTGKSKAVELTHANLMVSLSSRAERQHLTPADITFNWIAFDHVAALLESHMIALFVGAMQLHADPATILADPLRFLRVIHRYRVSVAFAPNFLLGQINGALRSGPLAIDLSCLRRIVTGGEANVVETCTRFLELLAPSGLASNVLWPAFGMTETCAASFYSHEFPHLESDKEFAVVGLPLKGIELRIADDTAVVPDGEAAELQLRGPIVFGRYYNDEDATRAAFTADGWFRTGDLGVVENGRLSLVGRSKDCVIVSGVNHFSHELESVLEPLDGIERSYVAAFPRRPRGADTEQLVVAFAPAFPMDDEAELHRLVIAIRNTTVLLWGFRPALILPLPRSAFPRTSLGKIQRSLMRRRLEGGELESHEHYVAELTRRQLGGYTPPAGETEVALAAIYAEMFEVEPASLSTTASFFDLGGTSLDIIRLTMRLSERLGADNVAIATILQNPTVRALASYLDASAKGITRAYDPVVPLQVTGRKTPLFCIHPAVGEVLVYVNLAKYFVNDRPFYALRARGFNEGESYFDTLDEVVSTYVDAIRRCQPHGPYAIAGYSFGGIAGFEVAKRLEAQGERVAFFCSIDMPPYVTEPIGPDYCAISLAWFLALIDKDKMLELLGKYRGADPALCKYLYGLAPARRLVELNLDLPKFESWAALTYSLGRIAKTYEPTGSLECVTVLFTRPQAGTNHEWLKGWVEVQIQRWDEFTRKPGRYVEVPGEHASLMDAQRVAGFQATLRAEIDRALEGR